MTFRTLIASMLLVCAVADTGAAVTTRRESKMVSVSQTVTGPAAGIQSKIEINVGNVAPTRGAMALAKGSVRISDQSPSSFPAMPTPDYSKLTRTVCTPVYYRQQKEILEVGDAGEGGGCQEVSFSEADIIASFDQSIDLKVAQVSAELSSLIKAHGAAAGVFTFEQELSTTALSGRRRLVWSAIMDPSGKVMYGKSKVVATTQFYLYMTYTPLAVSPKLPQAWHYPNPGTLGWTLVNSKMQALEEGTLIDTGGYFDEPPDQKGGEGTVKCLVDHSKPGCGTQYPDAVTLLAQSGADGVFIDFLHAVEPRYITVQSQNGDATAVAELTLQVPTRTVTTSFDSTCLIKTSTYSTSGSYQFNLSHSMTRYFVEKSKPDYKAIAEMASKVVSPVQSYSASVSVSDGMLGALPGLYIDPFGEEGPLVDIGLLPSGSAFGSVNYLPIPVCTPVLPPVAPVTPPAQGSD